MIRTYAWSFPIGMAAALMLPGPIDPGRALGMLGIAVILAAFVIADGTKEKSKR